MSLTYKYKTEDFIVEKSGIPNNLSQQSKHTKFLIIEAKDGNFGKIYLGDNKVCAKTCRGISLLPSQQFEQDIRMDKNTIAIDSFWIDAENNGDGVTLMYTEVS